MNYMTHDSDDHTSRRSDETPSNSRSRTPDGAYRVALDPDESPTVAVARAVASLEGVHPGDLEPLNDWIDPDALDALVGPRSSGDAEGAASVEFYYLGYQVRLASDGAMTIRRDDL